MRRASGTQPLEDRPAVDARRQPSLLGNGRRRRNDVEARPPVRLQRAPLPEAEVARIRAERLGPRATQWDYLHLEGLRRALLRAVHDVASVDGRGPVLDVFCGAKPYAPLVPWQPVWGLDLDRYFGGADVVAGLPLPFPDGAFGLVLCTQALHLLDDPRAAVREFERVLVDDGHVVVTIPHLFMAEDDSERHWAPGTLAALFAGWREVRLTGVDGPGAAGAFVLGRIAMMSARRWAVARPAFTPSVLTLNTLGWLVDRLLPRLARRWPHSLVLVARRPRRPGAANGSKEADRRAGRP